MTPSPNAGCSTSSPMRRPSAVGVARRRSGAPAGGDRRLDDTVAMGVAAIGRLAVVVDPHRRRYGRRYAGGAPRSTRPQLWRPYELRPVTLPCGVDQLGRDLLEEPRRRVVLRVAEQAAAPGVGDEQALPGPGDADVGEAALLLHLVGLVERPECGNTPSSAPMRNTTGNSRPFAECSVISTTWSSTSPSGSSSVSATSETCSRNSSTRVNSLGRTDQLVEVLDAPGRLDGVLGLQLGEVAGALERGLEQVGRAAASPARSPAAPCGRRRESSERDERLDAAQRRAGHAGVVGVAQGVEEPDARSRPRSASSLATLVSPIPALGHVEHALHAHLVGRVDDGPQVRHGVADLPAVVVARAADDLVRHAEAHERLLDDAALGVGAVEHGHLAPVDGVGVAQVVGRRGDEAGLVALVLGVEAHDVVAACRRRSTGSSAARSALLAMTALAASRIVCVLR